MRQGLGSHSLRVKRNLPVCVYPPNSGNGVRHYISNCRDCPKLDKTKHLAIYRGEQSADIKKETKAHLVVVLLFRPNQEKQSKTLSIRFFGSIRWLLPWSICADDEANENIMNAVSLRCISATRTDKDVQSLAQPPVIDMAATSLDIKQAKLVWSKEVLVDIKVHIRHGLAHKLQNVKWLVTDWTVCEQLLGRQIIDKVRLNTRELIARATTIASLEMSM